MGYLVVAYLVLRLVPTLEQALRSLKHVSGEWVAGAIALEVLSETRFIVSWRAIVDPDRLLERDGRGRRMDQRVASVGGCLRDHPPSPRADNQWMAVQRRTLITLVAGSAGADLLISGLTDLG